MHNVIRIAAWFLGRQPRPESNYKQFALCAIWLYHSSHMAKSHHQSGPEVVDFLGGSKVLGVVKETEDIQDAIRDGLPYAAFEALADMLQLTRRDVTEIIGMAPRTLARRKKHRQHLSPIESDRLYRIARITQLAADTLGGVDQARVWLNRDNRSLGGHSPLSMLDTEIGARQVEETLTRINYGMYA
jgi:putative toxin-antitoxin system antitoxin component (TIGR02293 family)